jgi:hypothetical protein
MIPALVQQLCASLHASEHFSYSLRLLDRFAFVSFLGFSQLQPSTDNETFIADSIKKKRIILHNFNDKVMKADTSCQKALEFSHLHAKLHDCVL